MLNWRWRLDAVDGTEVESPASPLLSNQSDAESWLGENWRDLAEAGVANATLYDGDDEVYSMSLADG